jgi:hypothetical protein
MLAGCPSILAGRPSILAAPQPIPLLSATDTPLGSGYRSGAFRLLEAFAPDAVLARAEAQGYLAHEFRDTTLLLAEAASTGRCATLAIRPARRPKQAGPGFLDDERHRLLDRSKRARMW